MAKPEYIVQVDFDEDGAFSSDEEITGDVLHMTIQGGKEVEQYRASATVLDLILNNESGKYSPTNSSSPLFPNINPGPDIRVFAVYPFDDFTDVEGTGLENHTITNDDTFGTNAWVGDDGEYEILSNQARLESGTLGTTHQVFHPFFTSDVWVGIRLTPDFGSSTDFRGIVGRAPATLLDFLAVEFDGTSVQLRSADGVFETKSYSWSDGDERLIVVNYDGPDITVYVDGELVISSDAVRVTDIDGNHFGFGGPGTVPGDIWDDFGGWAPLFRGRVDAVEPRPSVDQASQAYLRAMDDFERLRDWQVFSSAPATPTTFADIVGEILDRAQATDNRRIDTGSTLTQDSESTKALSEDALTEIYQVQDDEVGFVWIDGMGTYRAEDSDHRDSFPHNEPRSTWRSDRANGDETDVVILDDAYAWDDGIGKIENEVYYEYFKAFRSNPGQMVWRLEVDDVPPLNAGETESFLAVGEGDSIADPVTPLPATDVKITPNEDGTGTPLTDAKDSTQGLTQATHDPDFELDDGGQDFTPYQDGNHQIVLTNTGNNERALAWIGTDDPDGDGTRIVLYTTSDLSTKGYQWEADNFRDSTTMAYTVHDIGSEVELGFEGNHRLVKIFNNSGTDGFIRTLILRAKQVTNSIPTAARAEDTTSQQTYGQRRRRHDAKHIDRFTTAKDRAAKRIAKRKDALARLQLEMVAQTRDSLMNMLHRQIGDRVQVVVPTESVENPFYVEKKQIDTEPFTGGVVMRTRWVLVRTDPDAQWGTSVWGSFSWL